MLEPQVVQVVQQYLAQFATTKSFKDTMSSIFGDNFNDLGTVIQQQWLNGDFSLIPEIRVLFNGELGTANGAYAEDLDEILVSADFLKRHQDDPVAVAGLLLEEIGHRIDRVLNGDVDSPGDEGAIFRLLVTGQSLSSEMLAGLRVQDDHAIITLDNEQIEVEQQSFTGDAGGIVANDNLIGTPGSDTFVPGRGSDTIDGGDGIDSLVILNVLDTADTTISYSNSGIGNITGGSNNSTTFKNVEQLSLTTGSGNDNINFSMATGNLFINVHGGAGNDTLVGNTSANIVQMLYGDDGNDIITGGDSLNFLYGGAGDDFIKGGASTDAINPGTGIDTIDGVGDFNTLIFNNSVDTANTTINYSTAGGTTNIIGGFNNGTTFKNIQGFDLKTGSGSDNINLSAAILTVKFSGGAGNDTIIGSSTATNFNLSGDDGNDTITGGNSSDFLYGGAGDDILIGVDPNNVNLARGRFDYLSGGTGADTFLLGDATRSYYGSGDLAFIADFNPLEDKVLLNGSASNYLLQISGSNTTLYIDKQGREPNDLVATFSSVTGLSLTSGAFTYVGAFVTPTVSVVANDPNAAETKTEDSSNSGQFTFTRTGSLALPLVLPYTLSGLATNSVDYQTLTGVVTFAAGQDTTTVDLKIIDDNIFEAPETATLTITANGAYTLTTANSATVNIADDDTQPSITINDVSLSEEDSGNTAIFTVTLSNPSSQTISVDYATANVTAIEGSDYNKVAQSALTFAPGETTKNITIGIAGDTTFEPDETFKVDLSNPTNATLGTTKSGTGTILNNDPQPKIEINNISLSEGDSGTKNATFAITLSNPSSQTISVDYTTDNGTAIEGSDYNKVAQSTLTFVPGEITKNITVGIIGDTIVELDETFKVDLSNPTNATLGANKSGTGILLNDDGAADLVVTSVTVPFNAIPGQGIDINYIVKNQGAPNAIAYGSWTDAVYLSVDDKWDINDALIGNVFHSGDVAVDASYNGKLNGTVPGVNLGNYNIIVRSDIDSKILEVNENNNIGVSSDRVSLDVESLTLGIPDNGSLVQGQDIYYRVDVEAGETLKIAFDGQANTFNELYISYGNIPTRSKFDFGTIQASSDREIIIPTKAGTYYILAHGQYAPNTAPNYSIDARVLDFGLQSIATKSGGNGGQVTIEISGSKFDKNTIISLADETLGIEIAASRIDVVDSTKIFATFDLKGAKPEVYDLVAKNGSNKVSKLPDSFTISEGGKANLVTNIIAPAAVRPDRITPITIQFTNTGNIDLPTPLAVLTSDTQAPIALKREDIFNQTSLELLLQSENSPFGVLAPGATGSITFYANSLRSLDSLQFSLSVLDDPSTPLKWDSYIKNVEAQIPELFTDSTTKTNFWNTFRSVVGETVGAVQSNLLQLQQLSIAFARRESEISGIPFSEADLPNLSLRDLYSIASFASSYDTQQKVTTLLDASLTTIPNFIVETSKIILKDKVNDDTGEFENGTEVNFNVWSKGDSAENTYIIIHGFSNTGGNVDNTYKPTPWMAEMANSLKKQDPKSNIILVDWENGASWLGVNGVIIPYVSAAETTQLLGDAVGQYIVDKGYDVNNVTIIGHSLGAQTAGDAGEYLKAKGKIVRSIIGMDAAAPTFELEGFRYTDSILDAPDANQVIGVHTSSDIQQFIGLLTTGLGFISPYGHEDLYVNPVRAESSKLLDYDHPGGERYSPVYDHSYAYNFLNRLLAGEEIIDPNSKKKLTWDKLQDENLYDDKIANYTGKIWDFQERERGINLNPKAVKENSAQGTPIGIFTIKGENATRIPIFRLLDDAGGKFRLDRNKLVVNSLLDYETAKSYLIKVETKIRTGFDILGLPIIEIYDPSEEFIIQILDVDENDDSDSLLPPKKPPNNQNQSPIVRATDPNDIVGPAGFGDEKWIVPQILPYTIRFENKASATAPAQTVTITHPLDSDLDFGTFRLGSFGWGELFFDVPPDRSFYSQRIDLTEKYGFLVDVVAGIDIQKSQAFWTLTTIDPLTGEPPTDPFTGFLPPNKENGIGDGFVNYMINASKTVKNGDRIDAKATIVFDTEDPIDTPPIFNTIDLNNPTSKVQALAATTTDTDLKVTWAGTDDGSGVGAYDVYVSVNGGAYTLWQTNTAETSATYGGQPGSSYRFYSIATDNIGNIEIAPLVADAEIAIAQIISQLPTELVINNSQIAENVPINTTVGTFNATSNQGDTLTYSLVSGDGSTDNQYFEIVDNTIRIKITPDFEIKPNYTVRVKATNQNGLSTEKPFPINITDIAEPTILKNTNDRTFQIRGDQGPKNLSFQINSQNQPNFTETGFFKVDDNLGTINSIKPGDPGYLNAALDRFQIISSIIPTSNLPQGFDGKTSRNLNLNYGDIVRFGIVNGGSIDQLRQTPTASDKLILSEPTTLTVTDKNGNLNLNWQAPLNLNITATIDNAPRILGTTTQNNPEGELIDLRQTTKDVTATFSIYREAAYDNSIYFYAIQNATGSILDGTTIINPNDPGYIQAALRNAIADINLSTPNQTSTTSTATLNKGLLLAPIIVVNGTKNALLDNNPLNDPAAYTPFILGNTDKVDHIRLLGDNTFGFEDLPRGGDMDYNDVIVKASFK
jgi:Ca2+-binding RTX toxin-like protein/pimeloyl-ACP methyl ester carboxylesterase